MGKLYELDPGSYPALLAAGLSEIQAPERSAWAEGMKLPPDPRSRTILIGLGGAGVQTIDLVKGAIAARMTPNWKDHISFLAIDTDNVELDQVSHLTEAEIIRASRPGFRDAASRGGWPPFVDEDEARSILMFNGASAARSRLLGKMKLHYKPAGSWGADEEILARLAELKNNVLEPIHPSCGHYEVYVIGGISGGTGGGGFLELPALIRRVMPADARIHAMLYLPDTVSALDPYGTELMANGYASLKELDYYEGMRMRRGTVETFCCSDPASPELTLKAEDDFFTMPYLIGTHAGAQTGSKRQALETAAEFFIGVLSDRSDENLQQWFQSVACRSVSAREYEEGNWELEARGSDHSRPKRYSAVGVARAALPERLIRAYISAQVCKKAGLIPVSDAERAERVAAGEALLPFLGEDQFCTAAEVNAAAHALLGPLESYMSTYPRSGITYSSVFGADPTWDEIRAGVADDPARTTAMDQRIREKIGTQTVGILQREIQDQFRGFRNRVMDYVRHYGPMAFVNLYEGCAVRDGDAPGAVGIRKTLNALRDDLDPWTGVPRVRRCADDASDSLNHVRRSIDASRSGAFIDLIKTPHKKEQAAQWVTAYNAWINIRIMTGLRRHMLGDNGILNKHFIEPAELLCRQLYTFGKLLTAMAEGYEVCGSAMNSFEVFSKVSGGGARVNLAALSAGAYSWLKEKTDRRVANVPAKRFRDDLVESFFADPEKWMEFDERTIERKSGGARLSLVNANSPVGARYEFDRCLQRSMPAPVEVSVEALFQNSGMDANAFAKRIVSELRAGSQPLFHGDLSGCASCRCLLYPRSLPSQFCSALVTACPDIWCIKADCAETVTMFQLVTPFEMYRLAELKTWEAAYFEQQRARNGLHGRSPDQIRGGQTTWFEYPAITYDRDPKSRDAVTGEISREGQIRIEMDKVIEQARKKGILYSRENRDGWIIERVNLERSVNWRFDDALLIPDEDTGLLPEGRELLEAILAMNSRTLRGLAQAVTLDFAGQLSRAHSDEKWAWEYASRVLYAHRPMFAEIREALELSRPWFDAVEAINGAIKRDLNPAKMYRLIQSGILSRQENGRWIFRDDCGARVTIAGMDPAKRELLRDTKPREAAILDNGLELFFLFDKLMKRITVEELDEALERATGILNDDGIIGDDEFFDAISKAHTMLTAELEIVTSLGADLDNCNVPTPGFTDALCAWNPLCGKLAPEIIGFYSRIRYWDRL